MSQQTNQTKSPNAYQIASQIDRRNNGYPSFAAAFIEAIRSYELTDVAAIALFRQTRSVHRQGEFSSLALAS